MNLSSTAPITQAIRAAIPLLAVLALTGCPDTNPEPKDHRKQADRQQPAREKLTAAQAQVLSRLMPDPQIVNTHEHLWHVPIALAKLEETNHRTGVVSTALVASSRYTFTLRKGTGFVEHHDNNEYLCRLARQNPGEYYAFVTFDPDEEGITRKLEEYLAQGATGVKLYAGHGETTGDDRPFHVCPLDDPRLLPLYEYCQVHRVPICLHINMRKFEAEARQVFDRYRDLPFIVPHFGLWSGLLPKLDKLLTEYPALMTDNSFGWWYSVPGLRRYDRNPQAFRDFMIKHQDRILFGTDVVITDARVKSTDALTDFWLSYRCSLELEEYDFADRNGEVHHFKGLALPEAVLRKIYHENWRSLLERCGRFVAAPEPQRAALNAG